MENYEDQINLVGINDLTDAKTLAHLFLRSTRWQGTDQGEVKGEDHALFIDDIKIGISSERDPSKLKWGQRGADVIVESTGIFRTKADATKHLDAGAQKVIISAPASGGDVQTIVLGVNDDRIDDETTV
ncbi:MAG: glyceraldehyde 3-phosphate dehydrogenase NAD-binding domain-containing protein [Balneolaceae bacterium]|nr:glyceraldehyde 3-phosphate dehydrogenase NAD-binding domain-containing protein [Balneolaceae bacterium]